jgi:hypothetical protein
LQNNDPKSENKALKERAAKTKDVEARLKSTAREHQRQPRDNGQRQPKGNKSVRESSRR